MPLSFPWLIPPPILAFPSLDSLSHLHFAQPKISVLVLAATVLFQVEHELLVWSGDQVFTVVLHSDWQGLRIMQFIHMMASE